MQDGGMQHGGEPSDELLTNSFQSLMGTNEQGASSSELSANTHQVMPDVDTFVQAEPQPVTPTLVTAEDARLSTIELNHEPNLISVNVAPSFVTTANHSRNISSPVDVQALSGVAELGGREPLGVGRFVSATHSEKLIAPTKATPMLNTLNSELINVRTTGSNSETKVINLAESALNKNTTTETIFRANIAVDSNNKAEIGQKLLNVLADKITLQSNTKTNQATIRLDPPELGKIDLVVRVEGERLNVQINSSNLSVREAINQTVERLRVELVQANFLEVNVSVSDGQPSDPSDSDTYNLYEEQQIANNIHSSATTSSELDVEQAEVIARV